MTCKPKTSSRANPDLGLADVRAENGKRSVDVCAGKRPRRPCCCCPPRGSFTSRCLDAAALRASFPHASNIPGPVISFLRTPLICTLTPSPLKSSPGRTGMEKKSANGICVGTRINESSSRVSHPLHRRASLTLGTSASTYRGK